MTWRWRSVILVWPPWRRVGVGHISSSSPQAQYYGWLVGYLTDWPLMTSDWPTFRLLRWSAWRRPILTPLNLTSTHLVLYFLSWWPANSLTLILTIKTRCGGPFHLLLSCIVELAPAPLSFCRSYSWWAKATWSQICVYPEKTLRKHLNASCKSAPNSTEMSAHSSHRSVSLQSLCLYLLNVCFCTDPGQPREPDPFAAQDPPQCKWTNIKQNIFTIRRMWLFLHDVCLSKNTHQFTIWSIPSLQCCRSLIHSLLALFFLFFSPSLLQIQRNSKQSAYCFHVLFFFFF